MLTVGSLFSGIGGFDLGLERAGMRVEWQVENNEFCREVLKKHWPKVPCHYDITAIDWRNIPRVDLVCGGFPCQPFSLAGKRAGQADDRYLWPEVVRCLDALRPTWFLGENVPGLINLALDQVCADLEGLGYTVWPVCTPSGRCVHRLVPSMPRTNGNGSGLWPTPVANDDNKSPRAHMAMKARMNGGPRKTCTSLQVMVKGIEQGMWPTPNARDHKDTGANVDWEKVAKKSRLAGAVMWPTPSANQQAGGTTGLNGGSGARAKLHAMVGREEGLKMSGGQLNPNWVEALMGYPVGWTDISERE